MAYNNSDEGKESEFHEAFTKVRRVDELQKILNEINNNLFIFNKAYNKFNYELIIRN